MGSQTVSLGYLPKSFNQTQHAHWAVVRREKQQLQSDLEIAMLANRVPKGLERVEATAVLLVPDKRRRDTGNWRTPLEKALGDALVRGCFLADDTPDRFSFGELVFQHEPGVRATRVTLTWPD